MFFSRSNLLHNVLAASAASIPFVAAQTPVTTMQLYGNLVSTAAPAPGFNAEGGSVFTNYVNAVNNKQFFLFHTGSFSYEKPESDTVSIASLFWCSDLTFSDFSNSTLMGYAARCVRMILTGYAQALVSGGQLEFDISEGEFLQTLGISAVFVEQLNVFEGQLHVNTDDKVIRYWDDGRKTMPQIGWEGHDEGDVSPNAATSSFSNFGDFTWLSVEDVPQLSNTSAVDVFTPEKFKQVYMNLWIKSHEFESATDNPNPEAELEIIEQVKDETDSAGETMAPAQPDTEEDGGTDPATPIEDDSAGNGRKLASVAARFVSAGLRVFGI